MKPFDRRTYRSLGQAWTDFSAIVSRRREIRALMRGETLDPTFRERLMLAVTGVNRCRYCSYYHAREGLAKGLSEAEISDLAQGAVGDSPPDQAPALLYAQHWAETGGEPDSEARQRVEALYGETKLAAMELALRMIQMGNLSGNTLDYILYRISFGHWGTEGKR